MNPIVSNLFKYVIIAIILYILITFIPLTSLQQREKLMIFVILLTSILLLDVLNNYNNILSAFNKFKLFTPNKVYPQNSCKCTVENFETVQSNSATVQQQNILQNDQPQMQQMIETSMIQIEPMQPQIQQIQPKEAETDNDMKYTELPPEMHQPLGSYDETLTNKFTNDFALLNTDKWSVPLRRPPICIQEKECPVCPSIANTNYMDVSKFSETHKLPDNLNVNYIQNKLNPS